MQIKKQQLEWDMKQHTGPKLEKKYIKAIYCHVAYLTYMEFTSCKMLGRMKHKLESRVLGSVQFSHSITSNFLRRHGLQHARSPCLSPTPGDYSDSYPSCQWCLGQCLQNSESSETQCMNFLPWVSFSFLQPFDRKPSFLNLSMWLSSVLRKDPYPRAGWWENDLSSHNNTHRTQIPMHKTWVQCLGREEPLEKRMATPFSIPALRIQWAEDPGRLQSMALERVGYDWATNTVTVSSAKES